MFAAIYSRTESLGGEDASTTDSLDLLLSKLGEELGLHDDRLLGESTLAQNLEETLLGHIDDGDGIALLGVGVLGAGLLGNLLGGCIVNVRYSTEEFSTPALYVHVYYVMMVT